MLLKVKVRSTTVTIYYKKKRTQEIHFSSAAVVQPRLFSRSSPSRQRIWFPGREGPLLFRLPFLGYQLYSLPLTVGHLGDAVSISIFLSHRYPSSTTYMFVQRSFVVKSRFFGHRRERHSRQTTFKTGSTASAFSISLFLFFSQSPYVLTTAPSAVCASTRFRSSRWSTITGRSNVRNMARTFSCAASGRFDHFALIVRFDTF